MASNLDKYKADLERLVEHGERVRNAFLREALGKEQFKSEVLKMLNDDEEKAKEFIAKIPSLTNGYQAWYSEAHALIKQVLPDRLSDFVRHYEKPKGRKEITPESYRIEDALQGVGTSKAGKKLTDVSTATPHMDQQLAIVRSVRRRFESSLFEITQLVQADLFDSELDAARELLRNKFTRAAGAVAGVVLERHLAQVCANHSVTVTKKNPGIADLNELLKADAAIDVPQWRFNQHLADIRNLCDHNKATEPSLEQVKDLIDGVAKVTKTLF